MKDKNLRQKEACGPKDPRSPFVLSSLSDFQLVSLSVFVSRVCAPAYLTTNEHPPIPTPSPPNSPTLLIYGYNV
jgi:hypothetical protein